VAWFTAPDGRAEVKLAFSEDGGAGFSAPIRVDAGPEVLGRVGLQLEREGTALVSWLAGRGEAVSWRLRRVRRDGSVGRPLTLARTVADRGAGVGRLARIEGGVAFAWTSSTAGVRVLGLASADVPRPTEAARRDAAPELSLGAVVVGYAARDLEDREVRLETARGRPVLVHRWATWCEPCVAELPNLSRLHTKTSAWLSWAAVAVDPHSERGRVRRFVAARRLPFPVWLDPEDRLAARLGGGALPTTYLLDAEGRLVWRHEGRLDPEDPELLRRLSALRGP
jgi:thiol-disulfide isomerase/thioredoxin